ncbi:MAG TPA: nuclear transport factor 2 family protein, partial [Kofleriaceae bacterium]|nr:nuclear transport factor 2 family protein [Kofleriaceae bacterium]
MRTGTWLAVVVLAACGGGGKKPAAKPDPAAAAAASSAEPASASTGAAAKAEMPPPMSMAQKMEMTTRGFLTAWNAHEAETVANQYEADAVLRILPGGDMTGRDAIKSQVAETIAGFPDFKAGVSRVVMKGNVSVVEWVVVGTAASKRKIGVHGVSVFTFADSGLIKEEHRYWDIPTQMAQLDAKAKKGTFRPVADLPSDKPATLSSTGSPDEAKNLEVVNAVYAAIDAHKADEVLKYMDPNGGGDDYTEPASRQGTKGIKEYLGVFFKAVP